MAKESTLSGLTEKAKEMFEELVTLDYTKEEISFIILAMQDMHMAMRLMDFIDHEQKKRK